MKNHPLFDKKPDADVQSIHVARFENGRLQYAAQRFAAEELQEVGQIFERFGGGLFELVAHGETSKGGQGIVAKQEWSIAGTPKKLNPDPEQPAPPAAAIASHYAPSAPGGDRLDRLLEMMLQQAAEDRRMFVQMMQRPQAQPGPDPSLAALTAVVQSQGQIIAAAIARPPVAAPVADSVRDPIKLVLDVIEVTNGLKAGAAEALTEKAKAEGINFDELVSGLDKFVGVVKKAKSLADSGAGEAAATTELAAEAAAE